MSAYFLNSEIHHYRLLKGVRKAFLERCRPKGLDFSFGLLSEEGDHFFFESPETVFWGEVFHAPLRREDLSVILKEYEHHLDFFKQAVCPVIFFPSLGDLPLDALWIIPGAPYFFEYYFQQDKEKCEMGLIEWSSRGHRDKRGEDKFPANLPLILKPEEDPGDYNFFKYTGLDRHEVAELLEISFDLNKVRPS